MRTRPLTDDYDRQTLQCLHHGIKLDEEIDDEEPSGWGADPFDILAEIEERDGCPLNHN